MCEMTESAMCPQLVRECKEVLKGGLLMKQYYQFMLHGVRRGLEEADCNMDAFEEDLQKMLMVRHGRGCPQLCLSVWCVCVCVRPPFNPLFYSLFSLTVSLWLYSRMAPK